MSFNVYPPPSSGAPVDSIVQQGISAGWGATTDRVAIISTTSSWVHPEGASPANPKKITITALAGGGGGASVPVSGQVPGGGGGSAGQATQFSLYMTNNSIPVVIGAGGLADTQGGQTSILGVVLSGGTSGTGGGGGSSAGSAPTAPSSTPGSPGPSYGGATISGNIIQNYVSGAGGGGGGGSPTIARPGGTGGLGLLGVGGDGGTAFTNSGNSGSGYGSGGGGGGAARSFPAIPGTSGGAGAPGVVIIYY